MKSNKTNICSLLLILFLFTFVFSHAQIRVDSSKKYLVDSRTNKPFFWLGDTGWEIFHRLRREDVIDYLNKRKIQGFNVIQAVVLAEQDGLRKPNRYGDLPFKNLETLEWNVTAGNNPSDSVEYDYWDHVDYVIQEAARRDMYIGLLPTWGDKVSYLWGDGPRVFNEKNAYDYVTKLANRFKNNWNIIWILGGDRPGFYEKDGKSIDDRPIWGAMAKAIRDVDGPEVFITYHTGGSGESTSAWFPSDDWLSMNTIQSGHGSKTYPVWDYFRKDLAKLPSKPVIDLEPCYEAHPVNPWDGNWTRKSRGYFSSSDVRIRIYRGVFAGGCGTTYGHHSIWQFLDTTLNPPIFTGDTVILWRNALDAEVAGQMYYLKKLILAQKDLDRIEDSLLIYSERGKDYRDLVIATCNRKRTYALIHLPRPRSVNIDLSRLTDGKKKISWFNPATGEYTKTKEKFSTGIRTFSPPSTEQQDWVLVINVE